MDGNDPEATRARFPADGAAVAAALAATRRFADGAGLSPHDRVRLAIIVEELVANVVEHGAGGGRPIDLRLHRRPDAIDMILIDEGMPFDPRKAVRPSIPPARGGGAGIGLVQAWARITGYERTGGCNRLALSIALDG